MIDPIRAMWKMFGSSFRRIHINGILNNNPTLKEVIKEAEDLSVSIGAQISDYCLLYHYIVTKKPRYILECGTGKSTFIIAQAMIDAHGIENLKNTKIVSMEHNKEWYEKAIKVLPEKFSTFTDIRHSPSVEYVFAMIRGTAYREIPDYPYEFVFVDGPSAYIDNELTANMDFVRLMTKLNNPTTAFIDGRFSTVGAYGLLFEKEKVNFYPGFDIGVVNCVTKEDMITTDHKKIIRRMKAGPLIINKYFQKPV